MAKSLKSAKWMLFKFQGVDVRDVKMTLNRANALIVLSEAGDRQGVRDALLKLKGAVDKSGGELPDLTKPSVPQGLSLRRSCKVDIRTCESLTRIQAGGFVKQMKGGANGTVRSALLAMGAADCA